jgi:hypothetical protein
LYEAASVQWISPGSWLKHAHCAEKPLTNS